MLYPNPGDLVHYTTPDRKYTLTGIVTESAYFNTIRVEFPSLGRWFEVDRYEMSEDMQSRLVIIDDDATFGTDGVRKNY